LVDRIESHPMFAACRAEPATMAALDATLRHYDDPQQLQQAVPLFQLLSTSVENLCQRAERLAPQLAQASDVEQAVAVATTACLGLARFDQFTLPSYAIALRPTSGDTKELDRRLRNASTPIFPRRENDQLILDMRTVLPRDDGRLVEQIAGLQPTMPSLETAITNDI
jgi:L-seryl-tRNA(Ser) seleniumtransferase